MIYKTQLELITEILERDGEISRNQCLAVFISRLGSRILDLRHAGWEFKTEYRGNDYVYVVTKQPEPKQLELV